jgi:hypothetical protein
MGDWSAEEAVLLFFGGAICWAVWNAVRNRETWNAAHFMRVLLAFGALPASSIWIALKLGEACQLGWPLPDLMALVAALVMIGVANRTVGKLK